MPEPPTASAPDSTPCSTEKGDKLGSGGNAAKDFEGMDLGVDDSLDDL